MSGGEIFFKGVCLFGLSLLVSAVLWAAADRRREKQKKALDDAPLDVTELTMITARNITMFLAEVRVSFVDANGTKRERVFGGMGGRWFDDQTDVYVSKKWDDALDAALRVWNLKEAQKVLEKGDDKKIVSLVSPKPSGAG